MSNLRGKKSRRFLSASSSPMELQAVPKQIQGDEMFHFSHPHHPLVHINLPYLFTCNGCKEHGAGPRFKCQMCEFDLHDFCALAPPSLKNHPFHHHHQLVFFTKSGGFLRSRCDICGKDAKGFAFRCTSCNFEMHPCCAMMREEMYFPTHQHPLFLSQTPMGSNSSLLCQMCQRNRSGQVYSCLDCGYYLHAICAKQMVNGLYVHGIRLPKKVNMLGTAARFATHAIFGIIGGLIEGIGEGIGEALIDNIGRGRSTSMRSKKL